MGGGGCNICQVGGVANDSAMRLTPRSGTPETTVAAGNSTSAVTTPIITLPGANGVAPTPLPTSPGTVPDVIEVMLPTMKVDLTHATLEYGLFTLTDATSVLVPIWVYQGVSGVREYSYDVNFSALAIKQSYVHLAPSGIGPLNY